MSRILIDYSASHMMWLLHRLAHLRERRVRRYMMCLPHLPRIITFNDTVEFTYTGVRRQGHPCAPDRKRWLQSAAILQLEASVFSCLVVRSRVIRLGKPRQHEMSPLLALSNVSVDQIHSPSKML